MSRTPRREYFTRLGLRVRQALRLHKTSGLLERKDGKRDWGNVSEHCLVEAAHAQVFADWLGLPGDIKDELILAAALHDFNKKQEILGVKAAVREGGSPVEALYRVEGQKDARLKQAGFSERVVRFVDAAGALPETLLEVKRLLNQEKLSHEGIAFLVQHYTDAYTRGSEWVESARGEENDFDRRVRGNHEKYSDLERAVIAARVPNEPLFVEGKTTSEVMGEFGHEIERRFAELIFEETGRHIDPLRLPEVIDEEIKNRITRSS